MQSPRHGITTSIGLLVLRLGIGGFMASHGFGKLQMLLSGDYSQWQDPIGVGIAASLAMAVFGEFVCSLLVMAGFATRLAAIPPAFAMGVAAFVIHADDPLSMQTAAMRFFSGESENWFSKEPALLFLIPFLALVFTGPGKLSLDALIVSRLRRRRTAEAAAGAAG
jgi:putative oxidoreductase